MDNFVVDKENKKTVVNNMDDNVTLNSDKGHSLQNSFAKFREKRIKEMQLQKASRVAPSQRTPEFKANLRAKFVEECRKYIGIPYAERYKKPEDPISPLYLDCCALVRIAVQNLQEDFGFVIGKWNQCYHLDTCPVEVSLAEAKPGDLVFYYGTYTSKRSKKQKHDCVHVEVFLGGETGRATIGSRYLRGKVGIFDDFEFHSTTWSCDKITFRSLDTWLGGECKSHCKEHPWVIPDWKLSKNSIFDTGESGDADAAPVEESDDEGAGGEESEDEAEGVESTDISGRSPSGGATVPIDGSASAAGADAPPADGVGAPKKKAPRVRDTDTNGTGTASSTGTTEKKATLNPKGHSYYVSKSNGWKLIKLALDKHNWQQIPFEYKFSQRFSLKWVENRSEIDYKSHVAGQLVCHIPNSQCITCKTGLVNTLRAHVVSKRLLAEMTDKAPLYSPVKSADSARGKLLSPKETSTNPIVSESLKSEDTLTESASKVTQSPTRSGKAGCSPLRKSVEWGKAAGIDAVAAVTDTQHVEVPWIPDTYLLESPADVEALVALEKTKAANHPNGEGGIWIYKPSASNRGRGIKVVKGMESLKELCYGVLTEDPETTIAPARGIVQLYLDNPLLLPGPSEELLASAAAAVEAATADAAAVAAADGRADEDITAAAAATNTSNPPPSPVVAGNGHKFDIRCFLLVARTDPAFLAFHHPGYCRLALTPYSADPSTLGNNLMHLTNAAVQKKGPAYATLKNYQVQGMEAVAASLDRNPDMKHNADFIRTQLDHEIKKCMVEVIKAAAPTLAKKRGYFDLLGCDFMLTSDNQLKLLEINTNPALTLDGCDALIETLPNLVEHTVDIVLACQGPDRSTTSHRDPTRADKNSEVLNNLPGKFSLLYNENTKFEYE